METLITKVQVKDLRAGDDLGNCTIVSDPSYLGNYCGQKDRMSVNVRYTNGKESARVWGKHTTVIVVNK
jgi:hypothetical protein